MIEVRQDADGNIDEVVVPYYSASVHLENLGDGNWYLRIIEIGEVSRELTVNITPKRAFTYESKNVETVCTDPRETQE